MATIIDGACWTLTDKAAEVMSEKDIIFRCDHEHATLLPIDEPIYHISDRATKIGIGISNLHAHIMDAEKVAEDEV